MELFLIVRQLEFIPVQETCIPANVLSSIYALDKAHGSCNLMNCNTLRNAEVRFFSCESIYI